MNTKRVILLGLLVMGVAAASYAAESGVAAPSYAAESGVAAASYAAESGPQGGATTGSLSAQGAAATMWQGVCDWICPSAYAADKGAAPVAHWRFDEGGGPTAYDESTNNNDGTLTPGTLGTNTAAGQMWTRQGKIGGALECDGTDDYVGVGSVPGTLTEGTIEIWFNRRTSKAAYQMLFTDAGSQFEICYSVDTLQFYVDNVALNTTSANNNGVWQHVAGTFSQTGNYRRLYLNGVLVASAAYTGDATVAARYIGSRAGSYPFDGYIDDVRIYNYARTADQIMVDYNAGSAVHLGAGTDPNEGNPPILYLNFDENTGTTVYDRSGNNNNGSFAGSPTFAQGKHGTCVKFPTDDDYVNVPQSSTINLGASDFSVTSWVNIPKPVTYGSGIFGKYAHNTSYNGCFVVGILDNLTSLFFHHRNTGGIYESYGYDYSLYFGKWVHMAWVKSGTKLYLYLNGELKQTYTPTISYDVTFASWSYQISNTGWSPGTMTDLMIDEHKLYNYARTAAQIAYDYSRGAPVAHYKFDEGGGTIAHNEYSTADTGSSPVGWWRMDEGTGTTTADGSGNGNTGTLNPGTLGTNTTAAGMWDQTGKIGPDALEFDGTDDYVSFSANRDFAPQLTVELWVKTTDIRAEAYFCGNHLSGNNQGWIFGMHLGYPTAFYSNNVTTSWFSNFDTTITDGNWHHLAMVVDATSYVKGYIDGVEHFTSTAISNTHTYTSQPFGIAAFSNTPAFTGQLDDVRIYNYARTAEQIYNDYKTTHGTLVGDTKFVDGKIGKALTFDGTGDYVAFSDTSLPSGSAERTITAWVKTSQAGEKYFVVYGTQGTNQGWAFGIYSNKAVITQVGAAVFGNATINDNIWHHIATTWDGSTAKLYVDGKLDNSGTFTVATILNNGFIGKGLSAGYDVNALIDDVRIYNYARTAEQVMQDFNAGFASRLGAQSAGVADPWAGALPVAHWKLDENTGVLAYDASGNGNNGTLGGGTAAYQPTWTQGKNGPALNFDGSNDYVSVANSASLNITGPLTVSAWVYPLSQSYTYPGFVNKEYLLNIDNFRPFFRIAGLTPNSVTGINQIPQNAWTFVTGVYDGSTLKVYINGRQDNSVSVSGTPTGGASSLVIATQGGQYFSGKIDDVRIYNYARTAAQIAWDYNRGKPVGHWRFDEGSGTTAYDESDNNNDGTITIGATGTQTTIGAAWTNGATGKFGKCMSFDGTDDNVDCGTGSSLDVDTGNFTVTAWVKPNELKQSGFVVKGGYGYSTGFVFDMPDANGTLRLETGLSGSPNGTVISAAGTMVTGQWQFIAISVTRGGTSRLYRNGVEVGTGTINAGDLTTANTLKIGSVNTACYFTGLIDDVRVYNYTRTTSQIMEDYNQGMAVKLGD